MELVRVHAARSPWLQTDVRVAHVPLPVPCWMPHPGFTRGISRASATELEVHVVPYHDDDARLVPYQNYGLDVSVQCQL